MTVSSPSELIRALAAEDFDELLDTRENEWLDFKMLPPKLRNTREKWELAEDVAAFANRGIGYIVFGVRTEKHVNEAVEGAREVKPFRKDSVDLDACRQVIQSLVYPPLERLGIEFYPDRIDATDAVLVIEIVPQDERSIPFILRKALDTEGTVKGGVAIPIRDGDQTDWWPAERVHELITHGLRPLPPRLPEPNLPKASSTKKGPSPAAEITARADQLVEWAVEFQEWEVTPVYALIAMPDRPTDLIPSLYGDAGLAKLLEDPPSLRPSGFNLQTGGNLETIDGVVMARARHKVQMLDRVGIFAAVVPGDRSFLQWGVNDGVLPERHRINTLTLAEFTYEFFRFAAELKERVDISDWTYRLVARGFKSAGAELEGGLAKPGAGHFDTRVAGQDDLKYEWADLGSPEKNATRALSSFYAIFQRGSDDFAVFTTNGEVTAEAILAAARELV